PDAVAKNDGRCGPGPVVFCSEVAAKKRTLTDQLKEIRRVVATLELLRRPALVTDVDGGAHEQREARKGSGRVAPGVEIETSDAELTTARIGGSQRHDSIGIVERETAKQDRVHQGEHGGVDTDAEDKRHCRDRGEPA